MSDKNSGFRIRFGQGLRETLIEGCRSHDRAAAQVIRECVRHHISDRNILTARNAAEENSANKDGLA